MVYTGDHSASANPDQSINSIDSTGISVIEQPTKEYDIIIFGTIIPESIVSTFSLSTANMVSLSQYHSDKPTLSIMCESWIIQNEDNSINIAKELIESGSAVAVLNSSFDWKQLDISISIPMGQANVIAVYPTSSGTSSYSCTCDSDEDAIGRLMTWADSTITNGDSPMLI